MRIPERVTNAIFASLMILFLLFGIGIMVSRQIEGKAEAKAAVKDTMVRIRCFSGGQMIHSGIARGSIDSIYSPTAHVWAFTDESGKRFLTTANCIAWEK